MSLDVRSLGTLHLCKPVVVSIHDIEQVGEFFDPESSVRPIASNL